MFGFGNDLLVVNEEVLRQQRSAMKPYDSRDAAGVARVFRDRSDEVQQNEAAQQAAEREVVDLTGQVTATQKAMTKMGQVGLAESEKVQRKLSTLKSRLEAAKSAETVQTRIATARRENLNRWLEEGTPTNCELIELDRTQSEAL